MVAISRDVCHQSVRLLCNSTPDHVQQQVETDITDRPMVTVDMEAEDTSGPREAVIGENASYTVLQ